MNGSHPERTPRSSGPTDVCQDLPTEHVEEPKLGTELEATVLSAAWRWNKEPCDVALHGRSGPRRAPKLTVTRDPDSLRQKGCYHGRPSPPRSTALRFHPTLPLLRPLPWGGEAELGKAAKQPPQAQCNHPKEGGGPHPSIRRVRAISLSPASISRFSTKGFSRPFSPTSRALVSAVTSPLSSTLANGVRGFP